MKLRSVFVALGLTCFPGLAWAESASAPAASSALVLLDEALDQPNDLVGRFPPGGGGVFRRFGGGQRISAWTEGGVMELTYGGGYGTAGTGGLFARVVTGGGKFYHIYVEKLWVPRLSPEWASAEPFERIVVSLDALVPAGSSLSVSLTPSVPEKFVPRSRLWGSRIPLGTISGIGKFERYTLTPRPGAGEEFARLFRDAAANGLREPEFSLTFDFTDPASWRADDAVQLDNLRIEIPAR
jgi:hypothetical protein